jgi:peptidoglycan/LPS O-acetylase OafA/YrhL
VLHRTFVRLRLTANLLTMLGMKPGSATIHTAGTSHIPVLDGIRALAVLMVIGFHFWLGFGIQHTLVAKIAVWGQTGVDLFFVLSGFLITGILLDSKDSDHFLRNFYLRRILRIFPLYYGTLVAVYFLLPLVHLSAWTRWQQSIWYWTYLQNLPPTFSPSLASGPGHLWSLAVEEHYYLFWPLLVMRLNCNRLLKVIGLAIGISLLTRILLAHYEPFYFTLSRLDGLAMGSGLAILARTGPAGITRFARPARLILLGLGLLLVATQLVVSGKSIAFVQIVKSSLIAAVYSSLILLALVGGIPAVFSSLLSGRALGSIGKYSYGMYVLHPFILGGLHDLGLRYSVPGLLISVLATYLCAWLSWTLFEKHFLKMKRYFEYSKRPAVLLDSATGEAGDGVSSHFGPSQHAAIPASRT